MNYLFKTIVLLLSLVFVLFSQTAEELYNTGNSYKKSKNYFKAIEYYKKALKIKPNFQYALGNLSNTYFEVGNSFYSRYEFDSATIYYNLSVEADSTNSDSYFALGNINFNNKKIELAKKYYRKALQININLKQHLPEVLKNEFDL